MWTTHQEQEPDPTSAPAPTHLEMLAVARAVGHAAATLDLERLHAELIRLRTDLVQHLHVEQPAFAELSGPAAAVLADAQRRLLHLLDEVLVDAAGDAEGAERCVCVLRAAEIDLALRRHAKVEAGLLARRRSSGRRTG